MQSSLLQRILRMLPNTWAVFTSKQTPLGVKAVLALGLLYAISPYDLIPEWVPVVGVLDDLALAALLIGWANGFRIPKN